jgi:hypothetical protein
MYFLSDCSYSDGAQSWCCGPGESIAAMGVQKCVVVRWPQMVVEVVLLVPQARRDTTALYMANHADRSRLELQSHATAKWVKGGERGSS